MNDILIGIVMGSISDLAVMKKAPKFLEEIDIPFELTIVSAHRTPDRMQDYAVHARERGLRVIIAGAGGAAHLPGMLASMTSLPVIGVPIRSSNSMDGWDSALSILQMPEGVPVATVAVNGAKNAGILAAQIIASADRKVAERIDEYKEQLKRNVLDSVEKLRVKGWKDEKSG